MNHDSVNTLTAPVYMHHAGKEQSREHQPTPNIPEQDDSVQLLDASVLQVRQWKICGK